MLSSRCKTNKTGSHQCTRAVCSTFTEIHSTLTPRCIDALFGIRIPFQSLAQSPKGNPDSSPESSHVYTSHSPILQKRLVFLLHLALFRLLGLSKRKIIEPSLTAFTGISEYLATLHSRVSVSLTGMTKGCGEKSNARPCFPFGPKHFI